MAAHPNPGDTILSCSPSHEKNPLHWYRTDPMPVLRDDGIVFVSEWFALCNACQKQYAETEELEDLIASDFVFEQADLSLFLLN